MDPRFNTPDGKKTLMRCVARKRRAYRIERSSLVNSKQRGIAD